MSVRFLCLSDIHGHLDALSAVLATAERRGYDRILVAGDICFPGPAPLETWRRLAQLNAICVQGVGDRALATLEPEGLHPRDDYQRRRLRRLREVRDELGEPVLRQIEKLPTLVRHPLAGGQYLAMVHGSPADPMEEMTHDMSDDAMTELLGDETAVIVLCGGSHVPFDRTISHRPDAGAVRVINLGSVGEAPAGADSNNRFAHATFVEIGDDGIHVEQFVVPIGWAA